MRHWRLSPNCGRSRPWAPGGAAAAPVETGLGKAGAVPTTRAQLPGVEGGVRKLAKVSQVPLALPNPLFHPQPLETPLIPPSAVSGGVALLLQD